MPKPLTGYELDLNFQGGAVAIFKRDLMPPDDELIVRVDALRDLAAGFAGHRPNDATMLNRAAAAYEKTLTKT